MARPLAEGRHRRAVVRCYLTKDQKAWVAALARGAAMSESDLTRLLLLTASPNVVERLRRTPAYLRLLAEEAEGR